MVEHRGSCMSEERVYHVVRSAATWHVIREGFKRPHIIRETKEEAVLLAKRLAKTNAEAEVIVHDEHDVIESRFHYLAGKM